MPNEQVRSYIQENLNAGVSREDVKKNLLASGWQEADLEEAFSAVETPTSPVAPLQPKSKKKFLWTALIIVIIVLGIGTALFFWRSPVPPQATEQLPQGIMQVTTSTTASTTAKPVPIAATCTASNAGLSTASAIYAKGTVTSVDSTGKTQILTDNCANTTYLEKYICYESPVGSGHYASGRTVVKCSNGCINGACKK